MNILKRLLVITGFVPEPKIEEQKKIELIDKLEEDHRIMKEEEKYRNNIARREHIEKFYGIIRERRLDYISRKVYRAGHNRFLPSIENND